MIDSGLLFLGFSVYAWITILTVVSIFIVMSRSRIPAEVAFLGALTILLVTGVVTEEEGMSGFGSELIGRSMTQCDFEQRNNVALIAVARQGRRIEGQPREIQLQAGDTLLLECPPKDEEQLERNNRRSLTFFDSHFVPQLGPKTITSAVILVLMFIISSLHMLPLMATTMLAAGVMMMLGCCRITGVTISFASPIGSSTHMLIYGPGSFRFTDFARLGICMHIVLLAIALFVVNMIYPLY